MSSNTNLDKAIDEMELISNPMCLSIFKLYLKHLHKLCWLIQMRLTCFYCNKKFSEQKFLKNFKKYYLKLFRIEKQKFLIPKFTECFSEFAEYVGKTVGKSGNTTIHETNSSSEDSENYKDSGAIPMPAYLKTELFSFGGKAQLAQSPHQNDALIPSIRQSVNSGSRTLDQPYAKSRANQRIEDRANSFDKNADKSDKVSRTYYQNGNQNAVRHTSFENRPLHMKYPYKRKQRPAKESNISLNNSAISNNMYLASSLLDNSYLK